MQQAWREPNVNRISIQVTAWSELSSFDGNQSLL
jgi:hypothetical protein